MKYFSTVFTVAIAMQTTSCGLIIAQQLGSMSECHVPDSKAEGSAYYECTSNLGVASWSKMFTCDQPGFAPKVFDSPTPAYQGDKIGTCVDDVGNIDLPKHYSTGITCDESNRGHWLHVSGWAYVPVEYSTLQNNYWFKCEPDQSYPRPKPEIDANPVSESGSPYIVCAKDETLVMDQATQNPTCSREKSTDR